MGDLLKKLLEKLLEYRWAFEVGNYRELEDSDCVSERTLEYIKPLKKEMDIMFIFFYIGTEKFLVDETEESKIEELLEHLEKLY